MKPTKAMMEEFSEMEHIKLKLAIED